MYPRRRLRRLRKTLSIRSLVRETILTQDDLILPVFVTDTAQKEISTMPGVYRYRLNELNLLLDEISKSEIKSILLFGITQNKDPMGSEAYNPDGIVQQAIRLIKNSTPDLFIIADVCLCGYTNHGHCGVLDKDGYINNDKTLEILGKIGLSYAEAGVDMVAPSGMIDGQVRILRDILDEHKFHEIGILSYSVKYASGFYGPFREVMDSSPKFGDRKTHQMDYHNRKEAIREVEIDIQEGADMVMVKPALAYLDIITRIKSRFTIPVVAYNVSGEYSMVKLASKSGIFNEKEIVLEILTSIKRAGADIIITYNALEAAKWLKEQ